MVSSGSSSARLHGWDRVVHLLFTIGVIIKGFDGLVEIVGAIVLFSVTPAELRGLIGNVIAGVFGRSSPSAIATYLLYIANHVTSSGETFGAFYLLWHGGVKAFLVSGLLVRRFWAYPAAIVAFALFVAYQFYRYSNTRSPGLLALSVLDVVVILLTWFEYRRLKATAGFHG
jgi:uncharacterized membrane protein